MCPCRVADGGDAFRVGRLGLSGGGGFGRLGLDGRMLGRRLPRLHWADGVALFWWVCVSLNYVFVSPYPAAEVYGKAMALGVAYVALRLVIPYCGRAFTRLGGSDCVRQAAMSFGRASCSWWGGRHPGIICST